MAIAKSQAQLLADLDEALRRHKAGQHIGAEISIIAMLSELVDDLCFHCGQHFTNDDRPFFWFGASMYSRLPVILMHQLCLVDWIRRVQQDVQKIGGTA